MKKSFLLVLAILINCNAFAQIPQTISWQGILQDANGNNLNGTYNLTVGLYDEGNDGNQIWSEIHSNVDINNGLVNLELGKYMQLPNDFSIGYWVGITVGNGTQLPRIKLLTVPYSFYASKSSTVIQNDSLVLKDSQGVTRIIMNPNTGTFKMMNNDTVWYEMSVQSPPKTIIKKDGDYTEVQEYNQSLGTMVTTGYYKKDVIGSEQKIEVPVFIQYDKVTEIDGTSIIDRYSKINDYSYSEFKGSNETISTKIGDMETTTTNRYTSNNTLIEKNINSVVTENNKKIIKNEKYIDYGNQLEKTNESTETIETNRTEIIEKSYENNKIKEEKTVAEKFQIGGIWGERNVKTKETYNNGILTFKNTSENDNTGFKEEEFVKYSEEERTKKIEDVSINGVNIRKEISITKNANGEVKEMRDYYKEYSKNDNNEIFYSKNIQQYNNSTEIFIEDKKVINGNEVSINTTEKYLNNSISSRETSTYYSSNGTTIIELTHFKSDGTIKEQLIKIVEANGKVSLYNKSNEISSKGDTKSYKMGVNTEMAYFGDGYNNSNFYKIASLENYSGFVTGYTKEDGSNGAQIQYTSNNINISPTNTGTTNIQSNTNISGNTLISGNSTVAGNSDITGDLNVNGNKNFRIDHPDDPENKYLLHSSIESDEVLNQYTGNIITDANGFATVTLADYIQKINIDFRYQLTVIGQFAQAIISNEIENNQFQIQTDKPNVKVSWLITAKRNDKYMQENPFVPVQLKNKTR